MSEGEKEGRATFEIHHPRILVRMQVRAWDMYLNRIADRSGAYVIIRSEGSGKEGPEHRPNSLRVRTLFPQ